MPDPTPEEHKAILAAVYCLAIADNPHVNRQERVARRILSEIRAAVLARDIEWCKMLGFSEAGPVGNTPEFMRRELDSIIKDEPEVALAVLANTERCAKIAEGFIEDLINTPRSLRLNALGVVRDVTDAIRKEAADA